MHQVPMIAIAALLAGTSSMGYANAADAQERDGTAMIDYQVDTGCNTYTDTLRLPVRIKLYETRSGNPVDFYFYSTGGTTAGNLGVTTAYDDLIAANPNDPTDPQELGTVKSWTVDYDSTTGAVRAEDVARTALPNFFMFENTAADCSKSSLDSVFRDVLSNPIPYDMDVGSTIEGEIGPDQGELNLAATAFNGSMKIEAQIVY